MDDHNVPPGSLAQALRCLEPLAKLVQETVELHVKASGSLVLIAALLAVWLLGW